MARQFLTVPIDLVEHADCAANYFEEGGYTVKIERSEMEYPYTPTLVGKRSQTTMIVQVANQIDESRIKAWSQYGRSCIRDTQVALVLPADKRTPQEDSMLRGLGVGLYVSDGRTLHEIIVPLDLAVNVQLPDLRTHHPKMRRFLGPIYELTRRSQWREAFGEACKVLEVEARRYLQHHIATGRVTLVSASGKPRNYTSAQIDKMPMGPLGDAFGEIQNPNYSDSRIGEVLRGINKDRVGVTHNKGKAVTEARLRRNVGRHMYRVFAALRELLGVQP